MTSEWEHAGRLVPKLPPAVGVEALAAVGQVRLLAGDVPRGILRRFYEGALGLTYVAAEGPDLLFRHLRREIWLQRERTEIGRAAFLVRQFDESLLRMRERQLHYELLHTDGGLSRMALTRDPAGNWIHLVETRAF